MGRASDIAEIGPVCVHAPVRTADVGGWTDTWFAGRGMVTNVAVGPGVEVTVEPLDCGPGRAQIIVSDGGLDTVVELGDPRASADPFLAMAVSVGRPTGGVSVEVRSFVPPASGLGTSAAVSVAVIGALWALAGRALDPASLAGAAHSVETSLGLQSGIQDQLAAAFGGTHRYDIRYPHLRAVHRLTANPATLFGNRLATIYLGRPHASSDVHRDVIAELEAGGHRAALDDLRIASMHASLALSRGRIDEFGRALRAHNDATRRLHAPIVSAEADEVGATSDAYGGCGWKVNGAGGIGGTMSVIMSADRDAAAAFLAEVDRRPNTTVLRLLPSTAGIVVRDPSIRVGGPRRRGRELGNE